MFSPFYIGNIEITTPLVLAPMAGVTNRAFRIMCKRAGGCGLVTTEMFSAYACKYRDPRTDTMIDWTDEERPVAAQIFGGDPETVAIAGKMLQDAGADIIDINFGCPVPKVARSGSGAALLKDLDNAREILIAARQAITVPLTIKTRIGWKMSDRQVFDLAKTAEICGIDAITVHGRAAEQGYSGVADWDIIAEVKNSVRIPVLANGDISSPQAAEDALKRTGCDGLMIGRGALGDPWLFRRIDEYQRTGQLLAPPGIPEKLAAAREHARLLQELLGERRAAKEMRGHLVWYIKGMPGAPRLRGRLMTTRSIEEIEEVLDEASSEHQLRCVEA